jgi:hypothetical protein
VFAVVSPLVSHAESLLPFVFFAENGCSVFVLLLVHSFSLTVLPFSVVMFPHHEFYIIEYKIIILLS